MNLAQGKIWPLPLAPRRRSPSLWNVMPEKSTCLPGGFGPHCSLTMWLRGSDTASTLTAQPPIRLETEVSHRGGQPGLCDQGPIKTLDTKNWMSFLRWQYSAYCHTALPGKSALSATPSGEDNWKLCPQNSPGLCSTCLFPWLILIYILSL